MLIFDWSSDGAGNIEWGDIGGNLNNQTDLRGALGSKADRDLSNLSAAGQTIIDDKAETDLSNLSTAGKEVVSNLPMPSISAEALTVGTSGTSYTATANGWFCFSSTTASASRSHLSIALNGVTQHLGMVVAEYTGSAGNKVFCPVAKGDSVTVYYSNTNSVEGYFIYAEGDK